MIASIVGQSHRKQRKQKEEAEAIAKEEKQRVAGEKASGLSDGQIEGI